MDSRPASMLTKKQRVRIENAFEELDDQQRRRERQRIRERIQAGLLDFQHLTSYPDRQLELVVNNMSDDEIEDALVDTTLFTERVRTLQEIEKDTIVSNVRTQAVELSADGDDVQTLDGVEVKSPAEVQRETRAAIEAQQETDRWSARADSLLKLAAAATLPTLSVLLVEAITPQNLIATSAVALTVVYLSTLIAFTAVSCVLIIKNAQTLKHDILPAIKSFFENPTSVLQPLQDGLQQLRDRLRKLWDDL